MLNIRKYILIILSILSLYGCTDATENMTAEEKNQKAINEIKDPADTTSQMLVDKILNEKEHSSEMIKELKEYKNCVVKNLNAIGWTAEEHIKLMEVFGMSPEAQAMQRKVGDQEYRKRYAPFSESVRPCISIIYHP
jgi:hypothetical protein